MGKSRFLTPKNTNKRYIVENSGDIEIENGGKILERTGYIWLIRGMKL